MIINTNSTLVLVDEKNLPISVAMAFTGSNNGIGKPIYKSDQCFLHKDAYECLEMATHLLKPLHLKIKIWDAFRPQWAQRVLFEHMPKPGGVSHPQTGTCAHCRGVALDLTLTDRFGRELDMGTQIHDFRSLAHHGNDLVSEEAQRNRLILAGTMSIAGFVPLKQQWWYYHLPNLSQYPIIEPDQTPAELI